jgi:hypothetical protein
VIPEPLIRAVAIATSLLLACACSGNSTNGVAPPAGTNPTGLPGAGGAGTGGTSSTSGGAMSTGPDGDTTTTLPCDVTTFLREHCQSCHNSRPNHVAPMPLERREDFTARSVGAPEKTVAERVLERVKAAMNPMPPDGRLSDAALAPLTDWIGAGMPAGTCADPGPEPPRPFETLTRDSALTKVKTFLTGLAPEEAEFTAYRADPAALPGLIDGFLKSDAWKARELELFELLFQQRTDGDDLGTYLKVGNNVQLTRLVRKSGVPFIDYIEESFALTARDLVERGRPFTETVTTRTFMLNVPLMALLAHMDARPLNDLSQRAPTWLDKAYPNATVTYVKDRTIPWSDSIDPASPDFLHFSVPATPTGNARLCGDALDQTYTGYRAFEQVWLSELGLPGNDSCWNTSPSPTLFTPEDREFRPVTVRLAKNGEQRTVFWDLGSLRKTPELVLGVEYVGFLGSLGFLGTYTTNDSNEYRVTTNQALIVALGQTFTAANANQPADDSNVDAAHATPGTACYGCHRTLDPMRDFYRQSYTYLGSERTAFRGNESIPAMASFSVGDSTPISGHGVADFAAALAGHADFAVAWARKICGLANALPCAESDPELVGAAEAFRKSGYDFKVLLRSVLSSPSVTYATETATSREAGMSVGSALRDDFCRRLENRVGIADACAADDRLDAPANIKNEIRGYAASVPGIVYGRGDVEPDMPTGSTQFSTAAAERLCERLAGRFFGTGGGVTASPLFMPTQRAEAIDAFVHRLMGLSASDPRAGDIATVLGEHWDEVLATKGNSPSLALQSTFVLSCTSPLVTGIGL